MQIKSQLGKLNIDVPLGVLVEAEVKNGSFELLPILAEHVLAAGDLPPHHNDPFDRMLIAQARTEDREFVTAVRVMQQYSALVRILWS